MLKNWPGAWGLQIWNWPMKYKAVLFDFDGTIADSTQCIVSAVQDTFRHYELPVPSAPDITHYIGIPLIDFFPHLGGDEYAALDPHDVIAHYRGLYETLAPDHTYMFDGMREILDALRSQETKIAVVSSKIKPVLEFSYDILGIADYFDCTIGFDCVTNGKPHPETAHAALASLELEAANDIIVIGDATGDIEMGKAAGLPTCAVTWGAHDKDALLQSQPDFITHQVSELQDILISTYGAGFGADAAAIIVSCDFTGCPSIKAALFSGISIVALPAQISRIFSSAGKATALASDTHISLAWLKAGSRKNCKDSP